jgi:hypothetical protein
MTEWLIIAFFEPSTFPSILPSSSNNRPQVEAKGSRLYYTARQRGMYINH